MQLNIETVNDLKWCDEAHTFFECQVKYAEFSEVLPVGVNGTDPLPHIRLLWENALAGVYGPLEEFVPPPIPTESPSTPSSGTLPVAVL